MKYTKENLKGWGKSIAGLGGDVLLNYADAWAREVAELEKLSHIQLKAEKRWSDKCDTLEKDVKELRELCRLTSSQENQSGTMAYECVPFGRRTELDNRISELWAKHITKHMKGGEG